MKGTELFCRKSSKCPLKGSIISVPSFTKVLGPWADGDRLRMKGSMVGAPKMWLLFRKKKTTSEIYVFHVEMLFCCLSMFGTDKCSQRCDEY